LKSKKEKGGEERDVCKEKILPPLKGLSLVGNSYKVFQASLSQSNRLYSKTGLISKTVAIGR